MPRKKKPATAGTTELPSIPRELVEQLADSGLPMTAEQINAMILAPKKVLIEQTQVAAAAACSFTSGQWFPVIDSEATGCHHCVWRYDCHAVPIATPCAVSSTRKPSSTDNYHGFRKSQRQSQPFIPCGHSVMVAQFDARTVFP